MVPGGKQGKLEVGRLDSKQGIVENVRHRVFETGTDEFINEFFAEDITG